MKKTGFLLSVIFCLQIVLTGCSSAEQAFRDGPVASSLTGVLTEQTANDNYLGTHLLKNNGKVTALRSLAINLSSGEYLGNDVQVVGFLNTEDNVFEVTGVSVLNVLKDQKDKVESKIYKNSNFGVEFSYYSDWTLKAADDAVSLFAPSTETELSASDTIEMTRIPYYHEPIPSPALDATQPAATTVSDEDFQDSLLTEYVASAFPTIKDFSSLRNKIGPDQLSSIRIEGEQNNVTYFLYRNKFIYKISFIAGKNFIASNKKIFNELITGFTFIGLTDQIDSPTTTAPVANTEPEPVTESQETSSETSSITQLPVIDMEFTSFESFPYHFSAKYPKNWYYAGSVGKDKNVLHHYAFNNAPVESDNELISMDVMSSAVPSGQTTDLGDFQIVKITETSGILNIYRSVGDRTYRVKGKKDYESLMTIMIASITPVTQTQN